VLLAVDARTANEARVNIASTPHERVPSELELAASIKPGCPDQLIRDMGARLYTLAEVAAFLRVSQATVRRLYEEGKIDPVKVRGSVRISDHALRAYLQLIARRGQLPPRR
jgi:excisionase family DNA binding protein